ncbi:hypothetical protein EC973_008790 [Apophysomyces ossiformis]|uniref:C2H2-type domain-containing protein n=1 Tax=Apophysomyces ossiformis TaxID=679940 RepID=A0A8H7EVB1_9FUNG|nr:hypothetical protein EC973_008790 [Apophysomyces ossiformis]
MSFHNSETAEVSSGLQSILGVPIDPTEQIVFYDAFCSEEHERSWGITTRRGNPSFRSGSGDGGNMWLSGGMMGASQGPLPLHATTISMPTAHGNPSMVYSISDYGNGDLAHRPSPVGSSTSLILEHEASPFSMTGCETPHDAFASPPIDPPLLKDPRFYDGQIAEPLVESLDEFYAHNTLLPHQADLPPHLEFFHSEIATTKDCPYNQNVSRYYCPTSKANNRGPVGSNKEVDLGTVSQNGTTSKRASRICPKCKIACSNASSLTRHMSTIHNENRPLFHCDQCRKSYSRQDALRRHIREVHQKIRRPLHPVSQK